MQKYDLIDLNAIEACRPIFKYKRTKARHKKALKRRLKRMYGDRYRIAYILLFANN